MKFKIRKSFLVVVLATMIGCAGTLTPTTLATDFYNGGLAFGGLAKIAEVVPVVAQYAVLIDAGIGTLCALRSPTDAAATLQSITTEVANLYALISGKNNSAAANAEIAAGLAAFNLVWSELQSYVGNASSSDALLYLSNFCNGVCVGFNGPTASSKMGVVIDTGKVQKSFSWNTNLFGIRN